MTCLKNPPPSGGGIFPKNQAFLKDFIFFDLRFGFSMQFYAMCLIPRSLGLNDALFKRVQSFNIRGGSSVYGLLKE